MSYYLHCYRSELGWPDLKEAKKVVEVKDGDQVLMPAPEMKRAIANALMQFNPTLESPDVDFEEMAAMHEMTIEEAKIEFGQIEMQTAEGELITQVTIFDNIVTISVPLIYGESDAFEAFKNVDAYTKIIRRTAGYFVYDPQTGYVYDPSVADFDSLLVYLRRAGVAPMKREHITRKKKRWWKFWKR